MFRRPWIRRPTKEISSPDRDAISAQYWRDLNQLLDQGEITLDIAKRIEGDMFEPAFPGRHRRLNDRAWQIVLDGRCADLDRALVRSSCGGGSAPFER